jgi:hypothetical protein
MTARAHQLSVFPEKSVARARVHDPDTSHEAAASIDGITKRQEGVLRVFEAFGPMCDEKLVKLYDRLHRDQPLTFPRQSPSGIRSRRAELADPEKTQPPKIVYAGRKDLTDSGRKTRVWRVAEDSWRTT